MELFHNVVGILGSAAIILAYFLLQIERLASDQLSYLMLNLVGASAIVFSLCFEFNWSAFVVEMFWIAISLVGIARNWPASFSNRRLKSKP